MGVRERVRERDGERDEQGEWGGDREKERERGRKRERLIIMACLTLPWSWDYERPWLHRTAHIRNYNS